MGLARWPNNRKLTLPRASLLAVNRPGEATVGELERHLQKDPKNADLHLALSSALINAGRYRDALRSVQAAMDNGASNSSEAHSLRGRAHVQLHEDAEAVAAFRKALELNPQHDLAACGLAYLLACTYDNSLRDPKQSIEIAMRKCEATNWRNPTWLATLAEGLAANGDFTTAIRRIEDAITLETNDAKERKRLQHTLSLFREGKPLRRVKPFEPPPVEETAATDPAPESAPPAHVYAGQATDPPGKPSPEPTPEPAAPAAPAPPPEPPTEPPAEPRADEPPPEPPFDP